MTYEKPQLPYANDALEPAISARTIEFHYGKHEQAYIDNHRCCAPAGTGRGIRWA